MREAIILAASGDTIGFAVSGTITLVGGPLIVSQNLAINGPGAPGLAVNGNNASRVFQVINAGITVTIAGLTIRDGLAAGTPGADGQPGQPGGPGRGGGILNLGNLTLANCLLLTNRTRGGRGGAGCSPAPPFGCNFGSSGAAGGAAEGGAIFNSGNLVFSNCCLTGNSAGGGVGGSSTSSSPGGHGNGGPASGGAIYSSGPVTVFNTTFAANEAKGGAGAGPQSFSGRGGNAEGGAIRCMASLTLVNSTIGANTALGGFTPADPPPGFPRQNGAGTGGGLYVATAGGIRNTIIAGNDASTEAPDVFGVITSLGHNLIGQISFLNGGWVGSDLTGIDPQLGPLDENGGPTPTMALAISSPAINAGDDAVLTAPYNLTTDQRGSARRTGAHVDIGAFEYGPPPPSPGRVRFSDAAYAVAEEADSILITVWRKLGSVGTVTVDYATSDGTATAPSDYLAVLGTVVFNEGETSKTFTVRVINDGLVEAGETFKLTLSNPSNTYLVNPATTQVTILNDDRPQRLVTTPNDSGGGSLRSAIAMANNGDLILFAQVLTNSGIIRLTSDELYINKSLTILGPGAAQLAISGNNLGRVFHIGPAGNVAIHGLTITEGLALGASGNGPRANGSDAFGGGIYNEGSLALLDCMITTNRSQGGRGGDGQAGGIDLTPGNGAFARGGAIYNPGSLTLTRCTLLGNAAQGGRGGDAGFNDFALAADGGRGANGEGGAIWNGAAEVRLENCTFCGNHAAGGGGGYYFGTGTPGQGGNGFGGALSGAFVLESCTIVRNSAEGGGSVAANRVGGGGAGGAGGGFPRFSTARNSIIALNTSSGIFGSLAPDVADPNVAVPWVSQGWNVIGITDGSSGWTTNDFLGNSTFPLNPLLGPCQDNGGPVWTICPLPGSPARDQGNSDLATDARGGRRVVDFSNVANAPGGNGSDIGALEVDGLLGSLTITKTGAVVRVRFKTDPGNIYRLQQTSVMTNRIWTNVVSASGNGQVTEAIDMAATVPHRFYRASSVAAPAFPSAPNGPGDALAFDGINDHLTAAGGTLPGGNSPYTIEAWINSAVMNSGTIAAWGRFGFANEVNAFRLTPTGLVNYWWANDFEVTVNLNLVGGWHHVAATYDGMTRSILVDGAVLGSSAASGHNAATDNFTIGAANGGEFFSGAMDEVRIWNVSRSPAQILAAMRRQLSGSEAGLVAYYRFDDGAGLIASDSAAGGHYATLVFGPAWTPSGILPFAPTVRTLAAGAITATTATLNGLANPNSSVTTTYFEWGATPALGNVTPSQLLGSGTTGVSWSSAVSGLTPGATYYFRAAGANNHGTSYGEMMILR